jgi:hypothetical protein
LNGNTLRRIVELSGLSAIFAEAVVRRSIERAGFLPDALELSDIEALVPEISRGLSVFLGPATAERVAQIRALAR